MSSFVWRDAIGLKTLVLSLHKYTFLRKIRMQKHRVPQDRLYCQVYTKVLSYIADQVWQIMWFTSVQLRIVPCHLDVNVVIALITYGIAKTGIDNSKLTSSVITSGHSWELLLSHIVRRLPKSCYGSLLRQSWSVHVSRPFSLIWSFSVFTEQFMHPTCLHILSMINLIRFTSNPPISRSGISSPCLTSCATGKLYSQEVLIQKKKKRRKTRRATTRKNVQQKQKRNKLKSVTLYHNELN